MFNKNIAIAYDRWVILVDGRYDIIAQSLSNVASWSCRILINGQYCQSGHSGSGYETVTNYVRNRELKRGDTIQLFGKWHNDLATNAFSITKVD